MRLIRVDSGAGRLSFGTSELRFDEAGLVANHLDELLQAPIELSAQA